MSEQKFVVRKSISNTILFKEQQPLLDHIDIELTERCNNACVHCYINLPRTDVQAARREATTQQWKEIIRQAAELGTIQVRFTGGEPLLREDFHELYLYTRKLGMKVMLFTNARRITPELAELFVKVPPLKKIEVSVYGMRPQSYDLAASATGAFAEFHQGVDLLLAYKIPFVVKYVLLPQNQEDLPAFENWKKIIPGMNRKSSPFALLNLRAHRDSLAKNKYIDRLRIPPEEFVELLASDRNAYLKGMSEYCSRSLRPPGEKLFTCGAGEGSGCVDAYGTYQMCMLLRHPELVYNLSQGTLKEAHATIFPVFRNLTAKNPEYLRRCAKCFLRGLCEQCPAHSWMEHGTLDTPVEYLCQVAHAQARFLGLINEHENAWEVINWKDRIIEMNQKVNEINQVSTASEP